MCSDWKKKFFNVYFDNNATAEKTDEVLKLKNDKMPKYLFKYTGTSHIDSLLRDNLFYLSKISELNDPYEGNINYDLDLQVKRSIENWLRKTSRNTAKIDHEKVLGEVKRIIKSMDYSRIGFPVTTKRMKRNVKIRNPPSMDFSEMLEGMHEKDVQEFFKSLKLSLIKNTKLICLTESNKNNPMWHHYGCEHKGICIRYDSKKFNRHIKENCFPVFYDNSSFTDDMPIGDAEKLEEKYNLKPFLKKSEDWRCENEWRIIATEGFREKHSIEMNGNEFIRLKPSAVYLGKDFDDEDKLTDIRGICEEKNIEVYRMKQIDTQYELVEEEI